MSEKTFKRVNLLAGLKKTDLESPYGFTKDTEAEVATSSQDKKKREILLQQAWNTATSPMSSIFMNVFFFWMMGNSVHIFTLIFMFTLMYNTVKATGSTNDVFRRFEQVKDAVIFYKLIYMGINGIVLAIGLYKLYNMGLLPLHPADYVDLVPHMKVYPVLRSPKSYLLIFHPN